MRAVRVFGAFAALAAAMACNVQPGVEYDLGTGEQAITGGCSINQLGAPCDPDGSGSLQECQGVCVLGAGGTIPSVRCAPISTVGGSNDGKICGASGFGAGNCNQVCSGSLCVAKAAVDGTACRPGTATTDTLCDGQCVAGTCQRITSGGCTIEKPAAGAFNRECVWDWCSATNAKSCTKVNIPSGSLCDDANACTTGERCNGSGSCVAATTRTCPSSGTPCLDNKCNPSTGACVATPTTAACTFDACNAGVCSAGTCTKTTPKSCDDGNACTVDSCDATLGCRNVPRACPPPDACTRSACNPSSGACVNTPISCDDGNPCTTDSCNPSAGCAHTPIPGCFFDAGVDVGPPPDTMPPVDTGPFPVDSGPFPVDTSVPPEDTSVEFDTGPIEEDTGFFPTDGDITFDTGVADASTEAGEGGLSADEDLSRGGCGCRTTGSSSSTAGIAAAGLMAALVVARRRRR
jgi:MYXO-CTERM domain-containing protein